MPHPTHIGPDQYLDLSGNVAVSLGDVVAAWELAYSALEKLLRPLGSAGALYMVFGLQGAGKTTWIERNAPKLAANSVFLDGPLPSRAKRARAINIARSAGCKVVAVWVNTPFEVALEQNSKRSGLACIREEAIRHVRGQLEPPSQDEGFNEIILCHAAVEA